MTFFASRPLADGSRPFELLVAVGTSVMCGTLILVAADFPRAYQGAFLGLLVIGAALAVVPCRRITLLVLWVLVHPLSIEKVFLVGQPLLPDFFPPSIVFNASDVLFGMLVLSLALERLFVNRNAWSWPRMATPFAVLCLWAVLLLVLRTPSAHGMLAVVQMVKMLVFIVVLSSAIRTRGELLIVIIALAAAVGIQSLVVAYSYVSGRAITFAREVSSGLMTFSGGGAAMYYRAIGTMGHVNQQALFHVLFTLPLVGLLFLQRRTGRLIAMAIIVMSFFAIIMTFSRTAWLSCFLAFLIITVTACVRGQARGRSGVALALAVVLIVCICGAYARPIADRLLRGDEGATDSRKRAIALSLDISAGSPILGVGPNNWVRAALDLYPVDRGEAVWLGARETEPAPRYGRLEITEFTDARTGRSYVVPLPVHNKYLLILAELGGIGLALYLWFQWRFFQHVLAALRSTDRFMLWTGIGLMGAFWAGLCYQFFDLFSDDKPMQILLFVPVLAAAASRIAVEKARP